MCAAQGVDYRAPLRPGRGVGRAHAAVRRLVAPLERDRVLSGDIERLAAAIQRDELSFSPMSES
jgi:histidine ammonia-lyase